jgi:hypothetical protein
MPLSSSEPLPYKFSEREGTGYDSSSGSRDYKSPFDTVGTTCINGFLDYYICDCSLLLSSSYQA